MTENQEQAVQKHRDFFISYADADRAWAEWIAMQLENAGYTSFIRAWDVRPGANFITEMDEADRCADRTLLVLSPAYLTSDDAFAAWATAFKRDSKGKQGRILPVRVQQCQIEGVLGSIADIDLVELDEEPARAQLLAGVLRGRAKPMNVPFPISAPVKEQPTFPGSLPPIWNVPYRRNPFFTGRETLLKIVHEQLIGSKNVALTQILAIHGLGGIGKTQIAVEYAYRYQQEYQTVFWVRAAARDTLISDYVTIAGLLHLVEKDEKDQIHIVGELKYWFSRQKDWLLILDNADDLKILADFLPVGEKGHLLLTTRDPSVEGMARSIEVENLDMQEGIELLLRRAYGLTSQIPLKQAIQKDRTLAERIVKELGGLPLALDQAGAYIEQTRCGIGSYLEMYQRHRAKLLRWKRRIPSDYLKTVATTWALAFEQVEQHHPAAADLLQLCAFLDPDNIPEDLFTEGASELSPALQQVVKDALAFNETIDVLRSFSLIRRLMETSSLSIHRLVQQVLKDRLDTPTQQWAEQAVRLVNAAFPAVAFETWEQCKRYLPQVFACLNQMTLHGVQPVEAADLLYRAGWYLNEHARNTEAEMVYLRALAIYEKTRGPEHLTTSATLNNLANVYRDQRRYKEAEPLFLRSLAIYEKTRGPEHPDTSAIFNNLALLYRDQGREQEAEPLFLRSLAIYEKTRGPEHPDTSATLNNLALLYQNQGRYKEAENLFLRVLAISKKTRGPEHPRTATTLENYATLLQRMHRREEAAQMRTCAQVIRAKQQS